MKPHIQALLNRIQADVSDRMSTADDAEQEGETDIASLLQREMDEYFECELPAIVLNWEKGDCV